MLKPIIDTGACIGCGTCEASCPMGVLDVSSGVAEVVNPDECVGCWSCMTDCPIGAITDIED